MSSRCHLFGGSQGAQGELLVRRANGGTPLRNSSALCSGWWVTRQFVLSSRRQMRWVTSRFVPLCHSHKVTVSPGHVTGRKIAATSSSMVVDLHGHGKIMGMGVGFKVRAWKHFIALPSRQIAFSTHSISFPGGQHVLSLGYVSRNRTGQRSCISSFIDGRESRG